MGKRLAELLRADLKRRIEKSSLRPGLAVILVGDDTASQIYVGGKEKAAQELGYVSRVIRLSATATQQEVIGHIHTLNHDSAIHGILVQLPLPKALNEREILQAIMPEKDADGFHFVNQGKLLAGEATTLPCTPAGIVLMLKNIPEDLTGKHAVVFGRSNIVGKPMAQLLMAVFNMTVTVCHSRSKNPAAFIAMADLVVSATGVRSAIDESAIKPGAIVIDVGMHRIEGKVTGDLDLAKISDKAKYYTPVPGGVGPMTIAMLLYNTFQNAERIAASHTKIA